LVHKIFTFYLRGVLKFKLSSSRAKGLNESRDTLQQVAWAPQPLYSQLQCTYHDPNVLTAMNFNDKSSGLANRIHKGQQKVEMGKPRTLL